MIEYSTLIDVETKKYTLLPPPAEEEVEVDTSELMQLTLTPPEEGGIIEPMNLTLTPPVE